MNSMPDGPLQTVRVLDYSRSAAAGVAGRHLADLGARVVRTVDPASAPDSLDVGAHRIHLNWASVEGQQLGVRLAENADIVLFDSDLAPAPLIDADHLLDRSPSVVVASMSRFGAGSQPDASAALIAATDRAELAFLAGAMLAQAALAATIHRRATSQGQWVHTSLLEVALATDGDLRSRLANEPAVVQLAMTSMASTATNPVIRHPVTATETATLTRPSNRDPEDVVRELCSELGFTDNAVPALLEAGALLPSTPRES